MVAAADPETEDATAPESGTDSGGSGWRGGGMAEEVWAGSGASLEVVVKALRKADEAATEVPATDTAPAPDPEIRGR